MRNPSGHVLYNNRFDVFDIPILIYLKGVHLITLYIYRFFRVLLIHYDRDSDVHLIDPVIPV